MAQKSKTKCSNCYYWIRVQDVQMIESGTIDPFQAESKYGHCRFYPRETSKHKESMCSRFRYNLRLDKK